MKRFIRFSIFITTLVASSFSAAQATRLPADLRQVLITRYPDCRIRPDGAVETKNHELFLPLMPLKITEKSNSKITQLIDKFPAAEPADILFYSDGWAFIRVVKRGNGRTVLIPPAVSDKLRKELFTCRFPSDLIVPENFSVVKAMKPLIWDVDIALEDPVHVALNDPHAKALTPGPKPVLPAGKAQGVVPTIGLFAPKLPEPAKRHEPGTSGTFIFIASPSTGTITMVDALTLKKITEFPTDGTPEGLAYANEKLYIADQTKNRILILDPRKRQFLDHQIDLPLKSAPKGLAALPDGRLLYVSESASGNIDVIETLTNKLLLKTKVTAGPGRIALSPNGTTLLVLNVPSGQITLISTANQKVLGVVPVGHMPNAIAFSKDSTLAYISNRVSNTVSIVDLSNKRVLFTLKTGLGPTGLAISKDGSKLFVANAKENNIQVFDTAKREKLQDIKLPLDVDFPGSLIITPDGQHIMVSSASTDAVGILNVAKMEFESQPVIGHTSDEMIWLTLD